MGANSEVTVKEDLDLSSFPELPGVYIMKSKTGKVLYIGKAKNLKQRLKYYFQNGLDARKAKLMREVEDISFIVTQNEFEALVLEANLIKQNKPKYNVILRDDKNYPYIKITLNERFPHIEIARRIKKDNSLYFGPYVPAGVLWEALAFIRRNFNVRPCRYRLDKPMKPCIQYQMGRCPAPCAGLISEDDYRKAVSEVIQFLKGQKKELLDDLERRMFQFSEELRYEEAARIRDRIAILKKLWESQRAVSSTLKDLDVIGYDRSQKGIYTIMLLFVRSGILTGKKEFVLRSEDEPGLLLGEFIKAFYSKEIIPPEIIIVPVEPEEGPMLEKWLSSKRQSSVGSMAEGVQVRVGESQEDQRVSGVSADEELPQVSIRTPQTDEEVSLLMMAEENARIFFSRTVTRTDAPAQSILDLLKEFLGLSTVPASIGAFDISTTYGKDSTGGFVWWDNGEFLKERYRHVRVLVKDTPDDYAMLEEIIKRVIDSLNGEIPDLLMVDGGAGQLEVLKRAVQSKAELIKRIPELIAIAKDPDRIFLPDGRVVSLEGVLPYYDQVALLLRRIRDEVHRFAIMYHRKLRDKRLTQSRLEEIPGIGKKRRLELLRAFKSLDAIRNATPEEIASKVPGIGIKLASLIIEKLRQENLCSGESNKG